VPHYTTVTTVSKNTFLSHYCATHRCSILLSNYNQTRIFSTEFTRSLKYQISRKAV